MSGTLCLRNRQKIGRIDLRLFRRILNHVLLHEFQVGAFELCLHLVEAPEMARLNEKFLEHIGSTDVITFNHAGLNQTEAGRGGVTAEARRRRGEAAPFLHGEIFVCLDEALLQARRFHTTWQSELVRYAIHGLLHLRGFDDSDSAQRQKMKREENRVLRAASALFDLRRLGKSATHNPPSAI